MNWRPSHRALHIRSHVLLVATCMLCAPAWAADSRDNPVLSAWDLYKKGDISAALSLAETEYRPGERNSVVLTTLLGHIYKKKSDSSRALEFFREGRKELADVVWKRSSYPTPPDVQESYKKMYLGLLRDSSLAHSALGMCGQAMIDAKEIALVQGADMATATGAALSQMAFCKYQMQAYDEASKVFGQAHAQFPSGLFKDEAAYNAAATRAKLKDVDGSIQWLTIAIERDSNPWMSKVRTDEDFKEILDDKAFQGFLAGTRKP